MGKSAKKKEKNVFFSTKGADVELSRGAYLSTGMLNSYENRATTLYVKIQGNSKSRSFENFFY